MLLFFIGTLYFLADEHVYSDSYVLKAVILISLVSLLMVLYFIYYVFQLVIIEIGGITYKTFFRTYFFGWEQLESINGYLVNVGGIVYYEKKFSFSKNRFHKNNMIVQNFIKEKRGSNKVLFFSKNINFSPQQKFSFLTYSWVNDEYVGLFFTKKRLEQIQRILDGIAVSEQA